MADIRKAVEFVLDKQGLTTEDVNIVIKALVYYREINMINGICPPDLDRALDWSATDEGSSFWSRIQDTY